MTAAAMTSGDIPIRRTIHLYGSLRDQFRASYKLVVRTPSEAVRALCVMVPGFKREITEGRFRCVVGLRQRRHLTSEEVSNPWHVDEHDFHIIPVVGGSEKAGAKIIVGLALIVVAIAAPYALGIAGPGLFGWAGAGVGAEALGMSATVTFGQIAMLGAVVALGGIAMAISPQPQGQPAENQSFLVTNVVNTIKQGNCVPMIYGDVLVGSQVISMGITPFNMSPGAYTQEYIEALITGGDTLLSTYPNEQTQT